VKNREPAGLQYDHFKVGQLIICAHGPVIKTGPQFSPYGMIPASSVRNHQLVGSIYRVVGISGPFLALEPQGINYRGHNVLADLRSGVKFHEVDEAFLQALVKPKAEPRPQAPSPLLGVLPVHDEIQFFFGGEEAYGVEPNSSGTCGDPTCKDCNDDDDEDDEPDCSIVD
jgi:hypothetical protein